MVALGCADARPDQGTGSHGSAADLPYAPCPPETGVGEFSIDRAPDFTSAAGKVFDGVKPSLIPETLATEGECTLHTLPRYLCDPACPVATQSCGAGNQCVALPLAHSVGTVTLSGLRVPVEMSANATTGGYRPGAARLPHPAFEPGAELRLNASGGQYTAFELWGWGVSLLELLTNPIDVARGAATSFAWKVPAEVGPARLHVSLNIDNHGSSNAWIECDFADDGAAEIPASLIDALSARGRSGFPTLTLTRRTATSTEMALGCVQLLVTSSVTTGVAVAGVISCNDRSMCPEGQSCRPLERFCE